MRNLAPVSLALFLVAGVVSIVLWRELRTDRQLIEDLRAQLVETRTALAARPTVQAQPVVATLAPAAIQPAVTCDVPAAPAAKTSAVTATATLIEDAVRQQVARMENPDFRKARLTEARFGLSTRFTGMAEEIGLSDREMNALLDMLAENNVSMETDSAALIAGGATPDAATIADMERRQRERQQKQKDALIALLGNTKYEKYQEFDQTVPSRARVNNLNNLLTQVGRPLNAEQNKALTKVIIAEQRRVEQQTKTLRAAGQPVPSQQSLEPETNRRILEGASGFLDGQQIERMRARFEERNTMNRATERAQQAERAAAQGAAR